MENIKNIHGITLNVVNFQLESSLALIVEFIFKLAVAL